MGLEGEGGQQLSLTFINCNWGMGFPDDIRLGEEKSARISTFLASSVFSPTRK